VEPNDHADRPRPGELAAIIGAGAVHVLVEIVFSERVAHLCSVGIVLAFAAYLVRRARTVEGVLRAWGMRVDNFRPALRAQFAFVGIGALALVGIGAALGRLVPPWTFWLTLALYPAWGVAQQFALQNLIARNLTGWLKQPLAIAGTASVLFGISHFPRWELMLLTLVAGIFFTLIYRRFPNLWAVGIAHGILGSLAVHLVLGEDPVALILSRVTGGW